MLLSFLTLLQQISFYEYQKQNLLPRYLEFHFQAAGQEIGTSVLVSNLGLLNLTVSILGNDVNDDTDDECDERWSNPAQVQVLTRR